MHRNFCRGGHIPYSALSSPLGALDWSADTREKYFSINGGLTNLALFATGVYNGDGRQASHWKDNLGIGILDPTFAPGELGVITPMDILSLDVVGWDSAVPEPSTFALTLLPLALGALACSRRRARLTSGATRRQRP